ncbi:MAG: (Fe-S)-binding protein [Deltaproteobacteria bacterium]|nr:MAG: (Fe-S)-binding protein [Deltaproteobacteria bacterium]
MYEDLARIANHCLTCGTCSGRCASGGLDGLDPRKILRMLVYGQTEKLASSRWPWVCTQCGRCVVACPEGVDLVAIGKALKGMRPRNKVPGSLHKGVEQVLKVGNNIGAPKDEYLMVMEEVGEELAEECCPGFKTPIDVVGAEYLFFPNSKELSGEPDDMKWWWKVFYAGKLSWTVPSENWESVDWGLFTGNMEASRKIAQYKVDNAKKLKVKYIIAPDCAGGSFGFRLNYEQYFKPELNAQGIELVYIYDVLMRLFKEGRIKVDKSRNPELVTYHDPCKHGRELERASWHPYYDEARWIISQCCDDFVELASNKRDAFCCGAGSGAWAGPYLDAKIHCGRLKAEQIKKSGAKVVVTSCSNCRDQIMKVLAKEYKLDIKVKYIWQLVAESLVLE